MTVTKKQVHIGLFAGTGIIVAIIVYKIIAARKTAAQAAVLKQQQLTSTPSSTLKGTVQGGPTNPTGVPPLLAPLRPVGLANTDPTQAPTISIDATNPSMNQVQNILAT